ncbi:hypothetical protein [Falsiporphyromonas endometrii]|uniref:Uncharacterized protein n=1 Tax=Falsiporphyromonas endometrii TaxID=1387297 RepID=A0ABV9K5X9_9PORP
MQKLFQTNRHIMEKLLLNFPSAQTIITLKRVYKRVQTLQIPQIPSPFHQILKQLSNATMLRQEYHQPSIFPSHSATE